MSLAKRAAEQAYQVVKKVDSTCKVTGLSILETGETLLKVTSACSVESIRKRLPLTSVCSVENVCTGTVETQILIENQALFQRAKSLAANQNFAKTLTFLINLLLLSGLLSFAALFCLKLALL